MTRTHRTTGERLGASSPVAQVPLDAVVEFATSALVGLGMRWWIEHDLPDSPQEMDRLYHQLTDPGIRAGLQPKT